MTGKISFITNKKRPEYQEEGIDGMSDGRICASRKSLENAELEFCAKRLGSSNSCTLPLDKTKILHKQKKVFIDRMT
jgi:hypothetical protein